MITPGTTGSVAVVMQMARAGDAGRTTGPKSFSAGYPRIALPKTLRELVGLRASQINSCGFCTDIHTKEAAATRQGPSASGVLISGVLIELRAAGPGGDLPGELAGFEPAVLAILGR